MKCPIDEADLQMTDRQGIEIDYCSKCRGVWLDRGELDKIIDRSQAYEEQARPERYQEEGYPKDQYKQQDYRRKRKREGFLGDLFDFGG